MNGDPINLSDLRGKIVILNFWATWCPPCRAEMPHMQSFYEKNKDNGVEIIAVNLTALDEGKQAVEKFVNEYGLTFPVVLDENGSVGKLYEILTIPTSYIIDAEGRIFQKFVGSMDEQIMEDMIKSIQMYDEEQGE
ncbi:TlpA family protein disulfide reductase [Lysinibacillus sp. BW-2-10]|nr:TlpA family protein disulfide reductase [Lysinibacillus sp. BW-2-10]